MATKGKNAFRCVLHGSFRKHFDAVKLAHQVFTEAGIEVIAPKLSKIKCVENGFVFFDNDREADPRMIELLYLQNLKRLGSSGFSYFVNPDGYIGKSVSYELGIAQISNVPCFFKDLPKDHPVYVAQGTIWSPKDLAGFISEHGQLPPMRKKRADKKLHALWEQLMVPGSVVAVGGIIEYAPRRIRKEKEILFVRTHKWGGRYSIVGEKVRRNERLDEALVRGVWEETGLRAEIGEDICAFDQIKQSGYYLAGVNHIFVDKVARVTSKRVALNEEAEEYVWALPHEALAQLPLEPNARHTVELYIKKLAPA